jgi:hypothetical protein
MIIKNTMMDDICAVIGLNATLHLVAWVGGENLYIPNKLDKNHLLSKLIGLDIALRLCNEWPSQIIQVPTFRAFEDLQKRKQIVRMFEMGFCVSEISTNFNMTTRRVEQICREFEAVGLTGGAGSKVPKVKEGAHQLLLPGLDGGGVEKASRSGGGWPEAMAYKIPV